MNILLDELPTSLEIGEKKYFIKTDFRTVIRFEMLMFDHEMNQTEKLILILALFFEEIPNDIEGAFNKLIDFYQCGKEEKQSSQARGGDRRTQIYSFEHDASYIYAAFLAQYGVDITQEANLHWWRFKAMFDSLSEDNQFVKIMGYRAMTITSDMSPKEKDFYRRMQRLYAIPALQSEQEKISALEDTLLNGGDLSAVL